MVKGMGGMAENGRLDVASTQKKLSPLWSGNMKKRRKDKDGAGRQVGTRELRKMRNEKENK